MIGLTSAANAAFVKSLGCYDEVVTYDRVTSMPADSPVAYVDMAGNSELREKLHRHFGEQMKYSGRVGLTHRSTSPDEPALPGAKPSLVLRARPDPQARQGMGTGRRRHAVRRGMVRLRAESGSMAHRDRRPRACGGASRSISIRSTAACRRIRGISCRSSGIAAISSRPFCAIPNGYRLAQQGNRRTDGR